MGKLFNRAKMTVSGTPGTGTITLLAAAAGFQTFASAGVANADVVSYVIEDGTSWEYGQGTYTSSGTTLARTTVQGSSNAGSAISATSSALVFVSMLADDIGNGTAWTSYTPTVTTSTNSPPTSASATGLYKQIGKTVHVFAQISITTNGTAAGEVRFTLPVNVASGGWYYGLGREEGISNAVCIVRFASDVGTYGQIQTTANAYPGANGAVIRVSGTYQSV